MHLLVIVILNEKKKNHETPQYILFLFSEVLRNDKDSQDFEVGDIVKLLYTFATYKWR